MATEPTITTQSTRDGDPTSRPSRKQIAGTVGGFVATILLFLLNKYVLSSPLPDDVALAVAGLIGTMVTSVTAYLTPHSPSEGISYAQTQTITTPIAPPVAAPPAPAPVSLQPAVGSGSIPVGTAAESIVGR